MGILSHRAPLNQRCQITIFFRSNATSTIYYLLFNMKLNCVMYVFDLKLHHISYSQQKIQVLTTGFGHVEALVDSKLKLQISFRRNTYI